MAPGLEGTVTTVIGSSVANILSMPALVYCWR